MRPWECSQSDRLTDWQTQTDFIICPMLYAIAMGQIVFLVHFFLVYHGNISTALQFGGLKWHYERCALFLTHCRNFGWVSFLSILTHLDRLAPASTTQLNSTQLNFIMTHLQLNSWTAGLLNTERIMKYNKTCSNTIKCSNTKSVSYTHLTLPTNREV